MLESTAPHAAYDAVGRYDQDAINGFEEGLVERMLELADLEHAESVLDAMGGDGNLTRKLGLYCSQRSWPLPARTVLEYSRVQKEFAAAELEGDGVRVVWGDAISMTDLATGESIPPESFDRVLIKSALHELPLDRQLPLYRAIMRVLKPGGLFVAMGFLFEDREERDEFREIARAKDTLAGLESMARDRHFLVREEFEERLSTAGFVDVHDGHIFDYRISSEIVAKAYFNRAGMEHADAEFQVSQVRSMKLRRNGRIRFEGANTLMMLPGTITIARKPTAREASQEAFGRYPYDFVRNLRCHRELLDRAESYVPEGARVADLGCGLGLFAERLVSRKVAYYGVDLNSEYVLRCREKLGDLSNFTFDPGDMNTVELGEGRYDVVALLNSIYLPGVDVPAVLGKALAALKPNGVLIVSGPNGRDSFARIEPQIRAQLEADGFLPEHEGTFRRICEANAALLTQHASYYSGEGMLALLSELGASPLPDGHANVYYDAGYVVAVHKRRD